MSSLLQLGSKVSKRGVRLEFVIEDKEYPYPNPEHYPERLGNFPSSGRDSCPRLEHTNWCA